MVEWCDDERDIRSSFQSSYSAHVNNSGASAGDLAKEIAQGEKDQRQTMNFNETIYFEPVYEQYAIKDAVPVKINLDAPILVEKEQNENLMCCTKFSDS